MACVAVDYDEHGRRTHCQNQIECLGENVCHMHSLSGTRPRLPTKICPDTGILLEEKLFHQPRKITLCLEDGSVETRKCDMVRCYNTSPNGKRCENVTRLFPYCPTCSLFEMNIIPDIQIMNGISRIGIYAYKPFAKDEIISQMKFQVPFSDDMTKPSRIMGRHQVINEIVGAEEIKKKERCRRYGQRNVCNVLENQFDTLWKRCLISYCQQTTIKEPNAKFIMCPWTKNKSIPALLSIKPINPGDAIVVFRRCEAIRVQYTPPIPSLYGLTSIYDWGTTDLLSFFDVASADAYFKSKKITHLPRFLRHLNSSDHHKWIFLLAESLSREKIGVEHLLKPNSKKILDYWVQFEKNCTQSQVIRGNVDHDIMFLSLMSYVMYNPDETDEHIIQETIGHVYQFASRIQSQDEKWTQRDNLLAHAYIQLLVEGGVFTDYTMRRASDVKTVPLVSFIFSSYIGRIASMSEVDVAREDFFKTQNIVFYEPSISRVHLHLFTQVRVVVRQMVDTIIHNDHALEEVVASARMTLCDELLKFLS